MAMTSHAKKSATANVAARIVLVDGSSGYRRLISTFLLAKWPRASVEEVDPFSQTMLGAGMVFGTSGDVIVLGGIGTLKEAISLLDRLRNREQCPPVILLISREIAGETAALIAAGAAGVLFRDSLSQNSLCQLIAEALQIKLPPISPPPSPAAPALALPTPGKNSTTDAFNFVRAGLRGETLSVQIDGYRCLSTLAASPMAQVFYAERIEDRLRVVIKVITISPTNSIDGIALFCQRYHFLYQLHGHHVVDYIDAGVAGSWPYAVLEYLSSGDLRKLTNSQTDHTTCARVLAQLAEALSTIHAGEIAHLDLKPENIFFRGNSGLDGELVLIDFNISAPFGRTAKNVIGALDGHMPPSAVLGTPAYMSPEQGQGLPVDGRSDLYSAGVIFFEMLSGELPYTAKNDAALLFRHIHDEIPLLPKRVRQYQPIIDRLMAKHPDERFASGAELAAALQPFLSGTPKN